MVCELGMSEAVGPINYTATREASFLGRDFAISSDISEETLSLINQEVRRICDEQYARARELLVEKGLINKEEARFRAVNKENF